MTRKSGNLGSHGSSSWETISSRERFVWPAKANPLFASSAAPRRWLSLRWPEVNANDEEFALTHGNAAADK
jgi:hypothetical protein